MKKLLAIIPLLFLINSCTAQDALFMGQRVKKTTVTIYNRVNSVTTILLGSTTRLDTFRLKSNELWISPAYGYNPIFKIKSQDTTVTYQLNISNSYLIFWNKEKRFWDLKEFKMK
jgi:hypothetical protein